MITYLYQLGEEGEEYFRVVVIDLLPHEVGNLVGARGGGG